MHLIVIFVIIIIISGGEFLKKLAEFGDGCPGQD
jgi:hypothetical protein